ncbi:uncharacterized protein LOC123534789 [Mercenaria mercenaria]|uniref:uncharacterized protein LOC123534789 n=1 Tax=Mercenaria mercenaria TaxID=6596 RepID=UPI00234F15BF|nr:uncharacterized protein LOC123534789 [Mercenaria mercenaria]XP_045173146.2 uncharacterized protein LOC123534789 [Mercenaria mercenaria]
MEYISIMCVLLCTVAMEVSGHARLINPPGRSTMWRYGFNTPHNSDDHQLSCGGFGVQFYRNNGKCGICGDRYDGDRPNEAGGLYATGTIARTYNQGDVITVQVEITVNHGGWFEFKICPNNDVKKRATQECLDKYLLQQLDGSTRFVIPEGLGIVSIKLKLPQGLSCSQCVLQWKWNTASNVRCDGSKCCRGCGPQEQFYGCSDVTITGSSSQYKPPVYVQPVPTQQPLPTGGNVGIPGSFQPISSGFIGGSVLPSGHIPVPDVVSACRATPAFRLNNAAADDWCRRNCKNGYCPKQYCDDTCRGQAALVPVTNTCTAKQFWREKYTVPDAADKWCVETCTKGHCPLEYCENTCWARL